MEEYELEYSTEDALKIWNSLITYKVPRSSTVNVNIFRNTIWLDNMGFSVKDGKIFLRLKNGEVRSNGWICPDDEHDDIIVFSIPFWSRRKIRRIFQTMVRDILNKGNIESELEKKREAESRITEIKTKINKILNLKD